MKRLLCIMVGSLLFSATLYAQHFTGKGDQKLQAGFNFYGHGTGLKASYDYGISDVVSVGGGAVFYNTGSYDSKFFLFGRGDYHFAPAIEVPEVLDLYLGLELGLLGDRDFGLGAHAGARYLVSNNLSLFIEIGNNGALGFTLQL